MKMSKMTQKKRILKWMQDNGSITNRDAVVELAIGRLSARIHELRKDGLHIATTMETGKNRYGDIVSYARYALM